jgi:serine/threonine protein kinase
MNDEHRCAKCGALMTARTLRGLCPNCLAIFAFASDRSDASDAGVTAHTEGPTRRGLSATLHYIGDYELQEEIGRGGMGVVYKARQASLNRTVAVKMIIAGEFAGPAERKRFQREAEAAAQLRHPHIVAIHEVGEHEGRSYFSMDFIEGKTLSALLKEGTLSPARAAALVKVLAEAVHFAHQRGTLHRDLKPQNILIDADGQPHILDFGLARPVEREAALTRTGDVMGSPSYMPPEQAAGRINDIGPASDVYSLGAILYETITGRPPFTGETVMDVLTQVINQDPLPLRKRNPNVPADLETICLKCLEKQPERRYHSARALVDELERFLNFEPILARPASRVRKGWSWTQRNPWVFAAGLGFVALALICVAYGLWEKTQLLHSRLNAGKETTLVSKDLLSTFNLVGSTGSVHERKPSERDVSPAALFFLLSPGVYCLLFFVGRSFRKSYQRQAQGGAAISQRMILLHAATGVGAAVAGMGCLLLQIRSWVWQGSGKLLVMEIAGALCGLALNWVGFRMVWEAIGIHETSRYRGLVNQSLDRQLAADTRRWPVFMSWIVLVWWALETAGLLIFALGHTDFGVKRETVVAYLLCVLLSMGLTTLVTWAIRKRRRLFTFVCVPATVAGLAALFVALTAEKETSVGLLVVGLVCAIPAAIMSLLFTTRETSPAGGRRRFPVNPWLDIGLGVAFAAGIVALLYAEENWRGKAAWEKCKTEVEAKGAKLDWSFYIPPPIPDDQNIFKAPNMQEGFTGRHGANSFSKALAAGAPWERTPTNVTVAIITLAAPGETPTNGATVLRYDDPEAKALASQSISNAIGPMTVAPQDYLLVGRGTDELQPARIVLEYDRSLTAQEVAAFLPVNIGLPAAVDAGKVRVEPDGPIAFRVLADKMVSASDMLPWIKSCEPQLEMVRQALQRPLARMEGNYQDPPECPIPSFVTIRTLSQMLGAGAQSDLLRDDPDKALAQLTLMHDTRRFLQGPPGGQPETLVAAMINVAVAGLYANIIQDGLRLQAWRDPQLAALEKQLKDYDLSPYVERAFMEEQAHMPRILENIRNGKLHYWREFKESLPYRLPPRGWIYQNEITYVECIQPCLEAVDFSHHTFQLGKVAELKK